MKKYKIYFLGGLVLVNFCIFYVLFYLSDRQLSVVFLNVGQGDAIFITAPGGRQILIDGGPNISVLRALGQEMPFYDRSIDVVVATHADQDHIGGLVEVLKRLKVDLFIRTTATSSSAVYADLEKLIKEKNIKEEIIEAPERLILGGGAEFDIIFPDQPTVGWDTNDASIVGKLVYGQNSFLLTGDLPQKMEKYLVGKYGLFLDSDVLKVGHHGSKTSTSEIFVGIVTPAYSVISVGLNNRYGHPSSETMEVLKHLGGQILETAKLGSIIFTTDGQNLKISYD